MRTNRDRLVMSSVEGEITHPYVPRGVYDVTHDGRPVILPSVGGITYNVRMGDPALGWVGDHVEPGVSTSNLKTGNHAPSPNIAYNVLSCIGNIAQVITGDAKGGEGVVVGKHGGIEHVLMDFSSEVLDKLNVGDRIKVRALGTGLRLLDFEDVKVFNASPDLIERMGLLGRGKRLVVPVTHVIPASIMGSGLGSDNCQKGDYDIQLFDEDTVEKHDLKSLRLGDIVAIDEADHSFGRVYRKGMLSIGVVVHSDCVIAGHGPGVTTLLTGPKDLLVARRDASANLKKILRLPRRQPKRTSRSR